MQRSAQHRGHWSPCMRLPPCCMCAQGSWCCDLRTSCLLLVVSLHTLTTDSLPCLVLQQVKVSWGKNASGTSSKPPSGRRPGAYPGPQGPQPLLLPPMAPAMGGFLGSAPGMMPGLLGPQGVLQGALYGAGPGPGLRSLPPQLANGPMGHHHPGQQRYPAQPSRGAPHVSPVQPHVSPVAHPGAHLVGQGSPLLGSSQGMAAAVGGLAASPVAAAAAAAVAAAAAAGGGMSLPPASMTTAGILPGMMQQAAAANQVGGWVGWVSWDTCFSTCPYHMAQGGGGERALLTALLACVQSRAPKSRQPRLCCCGRCLRWVGAAAGHRLYTLCSSQQAAASEVLSQRLGPC
jgi:hypothetical protein